MTLPTSPLRLSLARTPYLVRRRNRLLRFRSLNLTHPSLFLLAMRRLVSYLQKHPHIFTPHLRSLPARPRTLVMRTVSASRWFVFCGCLVLVESGLSRSGGW